MCRLMKPAHKSKMSVTIQLLCLKPPCLKAKSPLTLISSGTLFFQVTKMTFLKQIKRLTKARLHLLRQDLSVLLQYQRKHGPLHSAI